MTDHDAIDALRAELAEARALYVGAQKDLNEAVGSVVALRAERDAALTELDEQVAAKETALQRQVEALEDYHRALTERVAAHAELAHIRDATKVGSMSWNFDQLGVAYEQLEARLAEQMADRADLESVIEVQTDRLYAALAERDARNSECHRLNRALGDARAELAKAVCDINTFVNALDEAEARLAAVVALCEPHGRLDANTSASKLHWAIDAIRAAAAEGTDQ